MPGAKGRGKPKGGAAQMSLGSLPTDGGNQHPPVADSFCHLPAIGSLILGVPGMSWEGGFLVRFSVRFLGRFFYAIRKIERRWTKTGTPSAQFSGSSDAFF